MSLDSALYDHLTADSTIAGLLATRLYPDAAPQDVARPYITYMVIATEGHSHMGGGSAIARAEVQLDVWSNSALERRSICDALFDRLHGFRGAMGTEQLAVRRVHFDGPSNSHERPTDGAEIGTYRGRCDVTIWHVQSVPTFP